MFIIRLTTWSFSSSVQERHETDNTGNLTAPNGAFLRHLHPEIQSDILSYVNEVAPCFPDFPPASLLSGPRLNMLKSSFTQASQPIN